LAGAAVEEGVTRKPGVEITVRLDNGGSLAVVQETVENEMFRVGSRVKVLTDYNGITRVSNLSYQPQTQPSPAATYPLPGR
jgi:outer membrane lipoprotein SlyB